MGPCSWTNNIVNIIADKGGKHPPASMQVSEFSQSFKGLKTDFCVLKSLKDDFAQQV